MKKWIFTALALAALVLPAAALAGKDNPMRGFGAGEVTISASSAKIKNDPGEWGGVYQKNSVKTGRLDQVTYTFKTDGDVQGGAPRWSIPIDTNADKLQDGYAFLDAANCGATVGTNDANVITNVSTSNPNCKVFFGSHEWDNWAAFAADNPSYRIAKKDIPFIIADAAGDYHVYGYQFG
jgi:hypothetical protein